ncbi:MAG: p-cumate dioxygenase [Betaproteobacteria bacterium]|nr:p-cumate dioxygenase [Betaproteobacteria bacterium]
MSTGLRSRVEDFLYHEAALLDAWKLEEWAQLFTEDGVYMVPATDAPEADASNTLFLIHDDRFRLGERARRLMKPRAHAEFPHSRVQHTISNVRVLAEEAASVRVECHFIVYRARRDLQDVFPGISRYVLAREEPSFRIREKRAMLSIDTLRPQGKLSIIL